MTGWATLIGGLILPLVIGFLLLALSQDQHRRALGAGPLTRGGRRLRRGLGYGLLGVALFVAIRSEGAAFGILLWAMFLSLAAYAVTFVIGWQPRWPGRTDA